MACTNSMCSTLLICSHCIGYSNFFAYAQCTESALVECSHCVGTVLRRHALIVLNYEQYIQYSASMYSLYWVQHSASVLTVLGTVLCWHVLSILGTESIHCNGNRTLVACIHFFGVGYCRLAGHSVYFYRLEHKEYICKYCTWHTLIRENYKIGQIVQVLANFSISIL
jgi:hypothetical protein